MPKPTPAPAADSSSSTMRAGLRDQLRHEIVTGVIAGGSRLTQSGLAKRFGVSTTPVREALHDLAAEGFIEIKPNHGAVVRLLSPDDVAEMYEIRSVLEPLVVTLAVPRLTKEQLDHLDELRTTLETLEDLGRWVELNRKLHNVFIDACGWERLGSIVGGLLDSTSTYVAIALKYASERAVLANQAHGAVIEAARARDAGRAAAHMKKHILDAKASIVVRFASNNNGRETSLWEMLQLPELLEEMASDSQRLS